MKTVLRLIGILLLLTGAVNLSAIFLVDLESLRSPTMVIVRYTLMLAAGLGFLFLNKWGVVIFFTSFFINWVTYFTVYGGEGSLVPLWLTIPIPMIVALVSISGGPHLSGLLKEAQIMPNKSA